MARCGGRSLGGVSPWADRLREKAEFAARERTQEQAAYEYEMSQEVLRGA